MSRSSELGTGARSLLGAALALSLALVLSACTTYYEGEPPGHAVETNDARFSGLSYPGDEEGRGRAHKLVVDKIVEEILAKERWEADPSKATELSRAISALFRDVSWAPESEDPKCLWKLSATVDMTRATIEVEKRRKRS
ncbi:hypothetical protein HY251_00745 [bacterium]|nr:hypothetical protein [bacterium]